MSPQLSNQAKQFLPIFKVWADEGAHPPVKLDRPVCVIGRREGGVNLPLHSPQVSKLHALVVRDRQQVYLRDLASTNGVHRNGAPVQEVGLSDEDVIRIGSYTLRCDSGFSQHAEASADSEAGASAPADNDVLPAAELRGERVSFPFPVGQHTVLIGRRNGCDLRLEDDEVAPVHAIVFQLDGKRHVRDLGAPGGTVLNGRPIHQEELKSGDELRIGNVVMRYALVDLEHDESDIPPLDGPHVPELDEPDIDALPDAEPELSAMDEARIPLLDESQAPTAEAPAPPPTAPTVAASAAPVAPPEVEPKLDPSESQLGMHDSFISIEDSQAPGTPDAGPQDSNVLEPPASAETSFHGEVVQYAGEVFAAHPEPLAKEDAVVKPPPPPAPTEAAIKPSPFDHLTPLGSHADDVHADLSPQSRPGEISKLVDEVAEKAGALKEVWSEYHAGQGGTEHDPDVTHPAP